MKDFIENYIRDRIIFAMQQMVVVGEGLFNNRKHETIMVVGDTTIYDDLFKSMLGKGMKFTVVIVDTAPLYPGRKLLQRLSNYDVSCRYTLINSAGSLMASTTKVFLEASYILGNGAVVAQMGTGMIAYLASQYKVPVIALCETYKFTNRVNLD